MDKVLKNEAKPLTEKRAVRWINKDDKCQRAEAAASAVRGGQSNTIQCIIVTRKSNDTWVSISFVSKKLEKEQSLIL